MTLEKVKSLGTLEIDLYDGYANTSKNVYNFKIVVFFQLSKTFC